MPIVAVGAAIGWVFIRRERVEAKPILPVDLLAKPVIALSAIGAYTAFTASMTPRPTNSRTAARPCHHKSGYLG